MDLLALKLLLTPTLIGAVSLAQRRWGAVAGGLIVGLPLTSGPVALFLALDHGERFAARAAVGTIAGLAAETAFVLAYAVAAARGRGWPAATLAACGGFVVALPLLRVAPGWLWPTYAAVLAVIWAARRALPARGPEPEALTAAPPWWDLPARMVVATAFVVALTAAAGELGPRWSGLLSPFPIYAGVLAAFTHAHQGAAAARALLGGVLTGLFAFATFFAVLAVLIEDAGIATAFAAAVAATLAVQLLISRRRGARPRDRRTGSAARPASGA